MSWMYIILVIVLLIFLAGIKKRGYFWKDRQGNKISAKEFGKRFKQGVEGITPLQQTVTTLWSFLPIFGGMFWGLVITFMAKSYWLSLILLGSLPITTIQFISNYQKYLSQKKIQEVMKQLNG